MDDSLKVAIGAAPGVAALGWQVWRWRRERKREPELSLRLDPLLARGPLLIPVAGNQCAFFRLVVSNARGKDAAREVAVSLENFQAQDDVVDELLSIEGMWLAWSDTELTNPRAERQTRQIPPGSDRRLDFIHLNAKFPENAIIDVRPQPAPGDHRNRFRGLSFSVDVVVAGENVEPTKWRVNVAHDGRDWDGQRLSAATRLSIPEPHVL